MAHREPLVRSVRRVPLDLLVPPVLRGPLVRSGKPDLRASRVLLARKERKETRVSRVKKATQASSFTSRQKAQTEVSYAPRVSRWSAHIAQAAQQLRTSPTTQPVAQTTVWRARQDCRLHSALPCPDEDCGKADFATYKRGIQLFLEAPLRDLFHQVEAG